MPYRFPADLIQLKAFLGANGVVTSALDTSRDVIATTNVLFSLGYELGRDEEEAEDMLRLQQSVIDGMGYPIRRILVRENLRRLPRAIISTAPANEEKRVGKLRARDRKHLRKATKRRKAAKSAG